MVPRANHLVPAQLEDILYDLQWLPLVEASNVHGSRAS